MSTYLREAWGEVEVSHCKGVHRSSRRALLLLRQALPSLLVLLLLFESNREHYSAEGRGREHVGQGNHASTLPLHVPVAPAVAAKGSSRHQYHRRRK